MSVTSVEGVPCRGGCQQSRSWVTVSYHLRKPGGYTRTGDPRTTEGWGRSGRRHPSEQELPPLSQNVVPVDVKVRSATNFLHNRRLILSSGVSPVDVWVWPVWLWCPSGTLDSPRARATIRKGVSVGAFFRRILRETPSDVRPLSCRLFFFLLS